MKKITQKENTKSVTKKLKYLKPKLNFFGKISKLTLGGPSGAGESGNESSKFEL